MKKKQTQEEIKTEKSWFLLLISFIEGGSVMAVELIGAKMTEPYFGASLYIWSSVLAITLLGLTTGYYTGGILSEKYPHPKTLYILLLLSSFFIGMMPIFGPAVMNATLNWDFRFASIISSLLFIFPPLVFLGMVSPIIIRKLSIQIEKTGRKAGLVYAISTIGGIFATFITGFYLIPEIGLRISSIFIAILLIVFPVLYFIIQKRYIYLIMCFIIIFFSIISNNKIYSSKYPNSKFFNVAYQSEGLLGQIFVIDDKKKSTRDLFVNNISQSHIHLPTGRSQWRYIHRLATYSSFKPTGSKVFIAGIGSGNLIKEMTLLGFNIDACDIEGRMGEIATKYFSMSDKVNIIIDDARHAIKTSKYKYDIVILDVSAGERQPTNLYSIESFNDIKSILKKNGILFIHYPSIFNGDEGQSLKSIGLSLKKSGFHVEFINTSPDFSKLSEYIYFASADGTSLKNQNFSRRDTFALPFNFPVKENLIIEGVNFSDGFVLTDDKPIMDKLHQRIAKHYRADGINITIKPLLHEGIRIIK
ncbi:MAG: fused MFS/spermidine synthase [Bacteroidia bacterium]|nr:fused MFS/spermidine synthase [Bacteroidia bacterium]